MAAQRLATLLLGALLALPLSLSLSLPAFAQEQATDAVQPERAAGLAPKPGAVAHARHQMVAAANPLAAEAGLAILGRAATPSTPW